MKFKKAHLGITSVIITSLMIVILSYTLLNPIFNKSHDFTGFIILTSISILSSFFIPLNYKISDSHVIISRAIKNVEIPFNEIREIWWDRNKFEFEGLVRVFGVGGFFGHYGIFYSSKLGKVNFFATNLSNSIIIKTNSMIYVITPEDPELFLEYYKKIEKDVGDK